MYKMSDLAFAFSLSLISVEPPSAVPLSLETLLHVVVAVDDLVFVASCER